MAPKTNLNNCEPGHCEDHSGLMMWVKINAAVVSISSAIIIGLFSYSSFVQVPSLRADVAKEIARLDAKDKDTGYDIQTIQKDVTDIGRRVSMLEGK